VAVDPQEDDACDAIPQPWILEPAKYQNKTFGSTMILKRKKKLPTHVTNSKINK
jgi:hypothetical protein